MNVLSYQFHLFLFVALMRRIIKKMSLIAFLLFGNIFVIFACPDPDELHHTTTKGSVFNDPTFWRHFETVVADQKRWKCNFPHNLLSEHLEHDATLYKDDVIFRRRRIVAQSWVEDDDAWIDIMLESCREIVEGRWGENSKMLDEFHLIEALRDFLEHIHYFNLVADRMGSREQDVTSRITAFHDIDKLDPVMLVGYSEKFEDGQNTSVWQACVSRHTLTNPHHQAHRLWHENCTTLECEQTKEEALKEMVCDKVSRRVQKELGGHLEEDMWNVNMKFFEGLPEDWLRKAGNLLNNLKRLSNRGYGDHLVGNSVNA